MQVLVRDHVPPIMDALEWFAIKSRVWVKVCVSADPSGAATVVREHVSVQLTRHVRLHVRLIVFNSVAALFLRFARCGKFGAPLYGAFVFHCVLASLFWQGFGHLCEVCSSLRREVFSMSALGFCVFWCLSLWIRSALFFSLRVWD